MPREIKDSLLEDFFKLLTRFASVVQMNLHLRTGRPANSSQCFHQCSAILLNRVKKGIPRPNPVPIRKP